jgi:hypothetical protein
VENNQHLSISKDRPLNAFQQDQINILAKYTPYSVTEVEHVFYACKKSFDKTYLALRLGIAYNSIETGIRESMNSLLGVNK